MRSPLVCVALAVPTALAACGDDGGTTRADASLIDARQFDAASPDCDYSEQSDLTNDTSSTGGLTETTALAFTTRTIVCGAFDHGHFDPSFEQIDGDSFTIDVAADTDLIVRILSPGSQTLDFVGIDVYNTSGTLAGKLTNYGDHGVASVRVPAGTFEVLVFAFDTTQLTAALPYRIELVADMPDTRCPEVATGGYPEANDTAQDDGNDVYAYPSGSPIAFTADTGDAPEPTNIVLAPDLDIRITGEAANINAPDKYEDTDTYEIATGLGINELAIRLAWPTGGANLDWHLYEQNTTIPIAAGTTTSTTSETHLTAIKPSTTYWLSVSALVGTTVPATYNATLCPTQFTTQ